MVVNIVVTGKVPDNPTIIEAFPSRGYVSTIAGNHLIRQEKMEQIGYIESDKLDAIAVVHDGKPMHPIRIYSKGDLVVLFSELIIPLNLTHEFSTEVINWFKKIKPKKAILLASIPGVETSKEHEILAVSTDGQMIEKIKALKIKQMNEGVLTGMSSSLMIKCCCLEIPVTSLMVETTYIPDVLAAASLMKMLSDILGLTVSIEELTKAGHDIEEKFRENLEQMKIGQENFKEMHQQLPMYR
ncbi:MAG: PAC2 family protein [Candidatus Altiarchaeota archaeon]